MPILLLCMLLIWIRPVGADQQPDPQAHLERVMANPHLQVEGQSTGEPFCWHAAYAADDFVDAYLAWRDTAWLTQAATYFDWLVSLLATGPDGYRGWIGPYIYDAQYWCDVHVGDAILFNPMLRFAEVVLADARLTERYGTQARRYVALARRDLFEKWDHRGTWHQDGPYGAYAAWNRYLTPGDLSAWHAFADPRAGLSLPFNKQMDMGLAALRLYRITGEAQYRQRAAAIFGLFKARMRHDAGGYVWNYWEPLGPWDIDRAKGRIRHWVNVHPTRNYQSREVAFVVEAYHTGVVFDRSDIERIIHTNLANMWNGDPDAPRWRNAGLGGPWTPQPEGRAGTLWSALADFDAQIRRLYAHRLQPGRIDHAYFHRVTAQHPPGFARRYAAAQPGRTVAPPPAPNLTMVAVLPRLSRIGEQTVVVCKAATADSLHIALHASDGAVLETLYSGYLHGGDDGLEGIFWTAWDNTGQPPGTYTVRWTLGKEHRQYKVELRD